MVDIDLLDSQNSKGRIGWGAQADWDQTLAILKNYRDLQTDKPWTTFHTNEFVPRSDACRVIATRTPSRRRAVRRRRPRRRAAVRRRSRGVGKTYRRGGRETHALERIDLDDPRRASSSRSSGRRAAARARCCGIVAGLHPAERRARCASTAASSTGRRPNLGIVFQSPVLLDWRTALDNVLLQVELRGARSARLSRARAAAARPGRPRGVRRPLSARAVGRHAPARGDRARADPRRAAAADGRAVRRARRADARADAPRPRGAVARHAQDRAVHHALDRRGGAARRPRRRHVAAPGTDRAHRSTSRLPRPRGLDGAPRAGVHPRRPKRSPTSSSRAACCTAPRHRI